MKDILNQLEDLHRPRLLIRAARHGADSYARERDLRRHVKATTPLPRSTEALYQLLEIEAGLDDQRRAGAADYNLIRHVDVLIAMVGEARILRATRRDRLPVT
ncbi:DUF6477 family protein [Shimia sp. SDUM112013]|uniref:DUF6477 family protein n=1 Tax=Shimia sp. SDUM112013 TaxID=3136160 RepID=UPI0032ECB32F